MDTQEGLDGFSDLVKAFLADKPIPDPEELKQQFDEKYEGMSLI